MATVKKISKISKASKGKKYQTGGSIDPVAFFKERAAKDTTKMYDRDEFINNINRMTRGEIKPAAEKPRPTPTGKGITRYAEINGKDTTYMSKADFEKKYADLIKKKKNGGKVVKKAAKKIISKKAAKKK